MGEPMRVVVAALVLVGAEFVSACAVLDREAHYPPHEWLAACGSEPPQPLIVPLEPAGASVASGPFVHTVSAGSFAPSTPPPVVLVVQSGGRAPSRSLGFIGDAPLGGARACGRHGCGR
jgi:hypothetical protein